MYNKRVNIAVLCFLLPLHAYITNTYRGPGFRINTKQKLPSVWKKNEKRKHTRSKVFTSIYTIASSDVILVLAHPQTGSSSPAYVYPPANLTSFNHGAGTRQLALRTDVPVTRRGLRDSRR